MRKQDRNISDFKKDELQKIKEALNYHHVAELKEICEKLNLPIKGKKGEITHRILTFLQTGKIVKSVPIPEASRANPKTKYPFKPQTLTLYGNYKNDHATRAFMKSLVGEHFHFTAYGQDWMKECWLEGNPPTYQEFAVFWQAEHERRKTRKAAPKQEWAYINFIQSYLEKHPKASQEKITEEWEKERTKQVKFFKDLLKEGHRG